MFFIGLVISCQTKVKEPVKEAEIKEGQSEPNIFVMKTTFPSMDGLLISADIYEVNGLKPTILLCHQAGYSRGEYKDTALQLNKLGYSCVAIDQRSGNNINNIQNETAQRALEEGLSTSYLDAKQDIEAAIDFMFIENENQPIILVGSSYSASLVLLIGKENLKVKAVVSFSPGEYLKGIQLSKKVKDYTKPVFVTSSQKEIPQVDKLEMNTVNGFLYHFKPLVKGIHGSRVLWKSTKGNETYWEALEVFLEKVKNEFS